MSPFVFLIAALVGLALGPVIFAALHRTPSWQLAVDGFVLVAVVGLVSFHVLPEAFEVAGFWVLFAAAAGLMLPLVVERVRALSSRASHGIVLAIAFGALLLHASLDGVGLGTAHGSAPMAIAIVLHRLPVGLAVWWLVRPQFGRRWAVAVLVALGVGTVAGFALQSAMVEPAGAYWVNLVQAFVAGSLLHVLLHQSVGFHDHTVEVDRWRIPGALGAIGAIAMVAGLPVHGEETFGVRVLDIALVAAPLLVALFALGFLVTAVRHRERFGAQVLRLLDASAPWAVAAIVIGAMVAEDVTGPSTIVHWTAVATLGGFILVSLAHLGPRDFLLEILPLDELTEHHDHDHSHELAREPAA